MSEEKESEDIHTLLFSTLTNTNLFSKLEGITKRLNDEMLPDNELVRAHFLDKSFDWHGLLKEMKLSPNIYALMETASDSRLAFLINNQLGWDNKALTYYEGGIANQSDFMRKSYFITINPEKISLPEFSSTASSGERIFAKVYKNKGEFEITHDSPCMYTLDEMKSLSKQIPLPEFVRQEKWKDDVTLHYSQDLYRCILTLRSLEDKEIIERSDLEAGMIVPDTGERVVAAVYRNLFHYANQMGLVDVKRPEFGKLLGNDTMKHE
jgi:hypothetical protein